MMQLHVIVEDLAPGLTDSRGGGPITAAQVIVSFSHSGRCRNDAAFAALVGTSPLEASSGHTVRHRLNRGGDGAFKSAIHTIAMVRMRSCPTTQAYIARRTAAEAHTSREIRAASSGYITRQLYAPSPSPWRSPKRPDDRLTSIESVEESGYHAQWHRAS